MAGCEEEVEGGGWEGFGRGAGLRYGLADLACAPPGPAGLGFRV